MGQGYDGSDWLAGYGVCAEEGLFGWLSEKLDKSGPSHPFLPFLPYQPPLLLSPQSLLLLLPVCTKSCRHTFAVLHQKALQHQNEGQNQQHGDCTQIACTVMTSQYLPDLSTLTESIP